MPRRLRAAGALALSLAAGLPVQAAPAEVAVSLDGLSAPGQFGVELHNNLVLSGAGMPGYPGQQAPHRVHRLSTGLSYGLGAEVELGASVYASRSRDGQATVDGGKFRLTWIAPHDETAGSFWGAHVELSRTVLRLTPTPWNAQLKGILGWRGGGWTLAANPNLDWSLSKGGGPVQASLDLKVARDAGEGRQWGLELYSELGPLRRLDALRRNPKTLYLVLDQALPADLDLNLGLGRGLTAEGDRWVIKLVVGTHF